MQLLQFNHTPLIVSLFADKTANAGTRPGNAGELGVAACLTPECFLLAALP